MKHSMTPDLQGGQEVLDARDALESENVQRGEGSNQRTSGNLCSAKAKRPVS